MSPKAATFMEFVIPIWERRFPGCKPPKGAARTLRPVFDALGDEEASNRLRTYLGQCPAQFVNLAKFATTHSEYAKDAPTRVVVPGRTGKPQPIEQVVKVYATTNLPDVPVEVDPTTGRLRPRP
jgi:hypothetical protein